MKKGRSIWVRLAAMVLLYLTAMAAVILITWIVVNECMGMRLQTADDFGREDKPGTLALSSDGFYEIRNREDYMIFWEAVEDGNFNINGRLLNDIRLNDTENMENWGTVMPEYVCGTARHYSGIFDGGGYTIYGLYAKDGYGIVCNNNGIIQNLSIKDSVVRGGVRGAGICLYNSSSGALISNCSFYGEIRSTYSSRPASLSGICALNEGVIDKCGFLGRMNVKNSTADSCDAAGICMSNLGKISNCYNLAQSAFPGKGKKYAITDSGEKNCYMLVNTGWLSYTHQTLPLTAKQSFLIDAYINKDINALISGDQPVWMTQFAAMGNGLVKKKENGIPFGEASGGEGTMPAGSFGARLYGVLQDEVVRNIVFDILCRKNGSMEKFSFDAGEVKNGFCLRITYGKESILLNRYSAGDVSDENELWKKCSGILSEKNEDTWFHETYALWPEYVLLPEELSAEKLLFYHTEKEENGIFYVNGENLYQVIPGNADGEEELALAGEYFLTVYDAYRGKEESKETDFEKRGGEEISVFQIAFRELLEEKIPCDGAGWKDEKVREAVCMGITGERDALISMEEILNLKSLEIPDGEGLKTLMDLEKLPGLTCLYVEGCDGEKIIKDLKRLKSDRLTELYLIDCGITDISFIENMPELTEVSFCSNRISDMTPLTACRKLTAVNFSGNQVTDLSPLKDKTNLTALGLAGNNISDITALENMTHLKNLSLSMNRIQDISVLGNMTEMEWLGLSGNEIEDFTPIEDMRNLFFLDVSDNPGQDIGELCLVPDLTVGMRNIEEDYPEALPRARALLNQYESRPGLVAEDLARGDLNGDGIGDIAVTGCMGEEVDEKGNVVNWEQRERKVYIFLGLGEGKYALPGAVQILAPCDGGIWGDPYFGIAICDNRLVVQYYKGNGYGWAKTDIYEYRDGDLKESCSLFLNNCSWARCYDWYVWDLKNGGKKRYAFAGEWEGHMEKLLLADEKEGGEKSGLQEEYEARLSELAQRTDEKLPEIENRNYMPGVGSGYYAYEIHEPLYETKKDADFILWYTAQTYMRDILKIPIPEYDNKEIKNNYDLLAGVELPEYFYAGKGGFQYPFYENVQILTYEKCLEEEDGGYVHMMKVWEADMENDYWYYTACVYYHESTSSFEVF